jgi:hypothetical protein
MSYTALEKYFNKLSLYLFTIFSKKLLLKIISKLNLRLSIFLYLNKNIDSLKINN